MSAAYLGWDCIPILPGWYLWCYNLKPGKPCYCTAPVAHSQPACNDLLCSIAPLPAPHLLIVKVTINTQWQEFAWNDWWGLMQLLQSDWWLDSQSKLSSLKLSVKDSLPSSEDDCSIWKYYWPRERIQQSIDTSIVCFSSCSLPDVLQLLMVVPLLSEQVLFCSQLMSLCRACLCTAYC